MRREDLVRLAKTQVRVVLVVLLVVLGGLALSMTGILERIYPSWSPDSVIPVLTAFGVVLVVVIAMRGFVGLPKCPHCKRLLAGHLLHIAIASGNCGYCGKSIEE